MRFFRNVLATIIGIFVFFAVLLEYYLSDYFGGESEGVVVKQFCN
jgi:hypothetical protein